MIMDNGSPWGSDWTHPYTELTVWLIRLKIRVSHSRPYHPQTMGKDERFHGTLERDLLCGRQWQDIADLQDGFDGFRHQYNFIRPHDALALDVPASRYKISLRFFRVSRCAKFSSMEKSLLKENSLRWAKPSVVILLGLKRPQPTEYLTSCFVSRRLDKLIGRNAKIAIVASEKALTLRTSEKTASISRL